MPDILIRGMEIESGRIAEILIAPDGNVYRNKREFCLGFGPIAHATKIPPHGDLIDRDKLKKQGYFFPCAIGSEYAVPLRALREAPTVIPAERSET